MTTPPADRPRPARDSALLAALLAEYRARTPGSATAFQRATAALPGGEARFVTYCPPYPVILAEGHGSRLLDVDGIEYLDLVCRSPHFIHGNAYPPAMTAAAAVLASGAAFPSPHELQLELAELLAARVPAVQRVRFTNSGTEASVLAARLAQRATGRRRLLLFDGAYHGSAPPLLADGPEVVTVPYNDADAVREALTEDIAAVFAEPFLGAGGVIPGRPEFPAGCRRAGPCARGPVRPGRGAVTAQCRRRRADPARPAPGSDGHGQGHRRGYADRRDQAEARSCCD